MRVAMAVLASTLAVAMLTTPAWSQATRSLPAPGSRAQGEREFAPGTWTRLDELPAGRLRTRIGQLPSTARQRALEKLRNAHFPEQDFLGSMRVDRAGGIYYADSFGVQSPAAAPAPAPAGTVPVGPFPAALIFHSHPASSFRIYLDFDGENVSGSLWNTYDEFGRTTIPALPYSQDSDHATFNDDEQRYIKEAWQRVAADRNVTQWSDGSYFRANNSQNDRYEIDQRFGYRADDHGNGWATATPLVITAGNIGSTTPESDPSNANPANKGVMQGDGDAADVFSFPWAGSIDLGVTPWIVPGGYTRGGNLDVRAELLDAGGITVASSDPPGTTEAVIQAVLPEGTYYLVVQNSATGNPFASSPDGYTVFGSKGQYFISATGDDADGDGVPDASDNCRTLANNSGAGAQCDSDGDGFGNRCDGDLNNNLVTNAQDATLFRQQLGQPSLGPAYNAADLNCNGAVNAQDNTLFRQLLGAPPGPAGLGP